MRANLPKTDVLTNLVTLKPSREKYDFFTDSLAPIEELINFHLKKDGRNTKSPIQSSLILNTLAKEAFKELGSITSSRKKTVSRTKRTLRRVFLAASTPFKLINYVAFEIGIVKSSSNFYYDKNGPDGGFNLYKGKKKPTPTDEEPEPEQIPLELFTKQELFNRIRRELGHGAVARTLRNKEVKAVGIHIELLKKTVGRKKIPQVRIVIIYGMSRFQGMNKQRKWMKRYKTP